MSWERKTAGVSLAPLDCVAKLLNHPVENRLLRIQIVDCEQQNDLEVSKQRERRRTRVNESVPRGILEMLMECAISSLSDCQCNERSTK